MKVIFLDMDGVLNHGKYLDRTVPESKDRFWLQGIDPEAVERLNRIVEATGAFVVVSSSWRRRHTTEDMQRLLTARGFRGKVIDRTGIFHEAYDEREKAKWPRVLNRNRFGFPRPRGMSDYSYTTRAFEVQAFLMEWKWAGKEPIESFAILDDITKWAWLKDWHVETKYRHGLLDEHVDQAIDILNKPAPAGDHPWR